MGQYTKLSFRNKTFFVFQDRKLKRSAFVWNRISWILTKIQLKQITDRKNENRNYLNKLNELKFCEVSRNSFSNICWKFQLSILKNQKILFLKKNFLPVVFKYAKRYPKDGISCCNFQLKFWFSVAVLSRIGKFDNLK